MSHPRVPSSGLLLVSGFLLLGFAGMRVAALAEKPSAGLASWYGEEHRGKLMANGKRFDPDKLTAASWFYPLGTKVRVSLASSSQPPASVEVTITDRGPAKHLVRDGRIIDLSYASFERLGNPDIGLLEVLVEPSNREAKQGTTLPVSGQVAQSHLIR
jgi:rare lipoprotein A